MFFQGFLVVMVYSMEILYHILTFLVGFPQTIDGSLIYNFSKEEKQQQWWKTDLLCSLPGIFFIVIWLTLLCEIPVVTAAALRWELPSSTERWVWERACAKELAYGVNCKGRGLEEWLLGGLSQTFHYTRVKDGQKLEESEQWLLEEGELEVTLWKRLTRLVLLRIQVEALDTVSRK